jgi:rare lipoprotein A (peptidoglycan hydrolase)
MRRLIPMVLAGLLLTGGCGVTSPRFASREKTTPATPLPTSPDGLSGIASYYADDFHGRKTANGEVYDMHALTAAHRTLPFNTMVKVTNLETNMSVVVRINDRGPFKDDRVIDLSMEAAIKIGLISNGTGPVRLEIVSPGDTLQQSPP